MVVFVFCRDKGNFYSRLLSECSMLILIFDILWKNHNSMRTHEIERNQCRSSSRRITSAAIHSCTERENRLIWWYVNRHWTSKTCCCRCVSAHNINDAWVMRRCTEAILSSTHVCMCIHPATSASCNCTLAPLEPLGTKRSIQTVVLFI